MRRFWCVFLLTQFPECERSNLSRGQAIDEQLPNLMQGAFSQATTVLGVVVVVTSIVPAMFTFFVLAAVPFVMVQVCVRSGQYLSFQALCSTQYWEFEPELRTCHEAWSCANHIQRRAPNSLK